ncbi:MAG: YkgJ family cysteine cluster protein [Desulfuromonadaceae bacterium]|nr:YkgJ family cysteine cluster protein [Desulfuromonadaceae bacterium]
MLTIEAEHIEEYVEHGFTDIEALFLYFHPVLTSIAFEYRMDNTMQTLTSTTPEFDFNTWGQKLHSSFQGHIDAAAPVQLSLKEFLQQVEGELCAGLHASDSEMIACNAGCSACCRVNVATLVPEAYNIAAYLRHTRSAAELARLRAQMRQMLVVIGGLDDDERIATNQPCVFLDQEGSCSIYPVRPLLCRSITSTSAEACRAALGWTMFEEPSSVMMNMFQKELMDTAFTALAQIWHESGGDSRSRELTAAVYPLV